MQNWHTDCVFSMSVKQLMIARKQIEKEMEKLTRNSDPVLSGRKTGKAWALPAPPPSSPADMCSTASSKSSSDTDCMAKARDEYGHAWEQRFSSLEHKMEVLLNLKMCEENSKGKGDFVSTTQVLNPGFVELGVQKNAEAPLGAGQNMSSSTAYDKMANTYDPRQILKVSSSQNRVLYIHQFLTEEAEARRQARITDPANDTLYMGVAIEEWGAANMRLMNELLSCGQLDRGDVEYYMAYTSTIFDFCSRYTWESILHFDHQYREQQVQHGFKWGFINPIAQNQCLIPKNGHVSGGDLVRRPRGGVRYATYKDPGAALEVCPNYLFAKICPLGNKCPYKHLV